MAQASPPQAELSAEDGLHRDKGGEQAEQGLPIAGRRSGHQARNRSRGHASPQRGERGEQERAVHRAMERHPAMQRRIWRPQHHRATEEREEEAQQNAARGESQARAVGA